MSQEKQLSKEETWHRLCVAVVALAVACAELKNALDAHGEAKSLAGEQQ